MAEEIGDRDKDTMHLLKWKCTNECRKLTSEEVALVLRTESLFQMSGHFEISTYSNIAILIQSELPSRSAPLAPVLLP